MILIFTLCLSFLWKSIVLATFVTKIVLLQTYGLQLKNSSAVEMCTFVSKVQEDSAAESAGLTAGEPPTSSLPYSRYTQALIHIQNRQTLFFLSGVHRLTDISLATNETTLPTHLRTHTSTDAQIQYKVILPSRKLIASFFCILIYCRRYYCHNQRGQHWRLISSAHTRSDKRINQQLKVSDINDNFLKYWHNKVQENKEIKAVL